MDAKVQQGIVIKPIEQIELDVPGLFTPRPGNKTDHYRAASGHETIEVIEA